MVKAVKRTIRKTAARTTRKKVTKKVTRKRPASPGKQTRPRIVSGRKKAAAGSQKPVKSNLTPRKPAAKKIKPEQQPTPKKTVIISGRVSAPAVRLGMTPPEVRETTGKPECILFGSDDHVEWQFGTRGFDVVGAATLYVTTLTFASGRVVRITERMSEALA